MNEPEPVRYAFNKESLMKIRQAFLAVVDVLEVELGIKPRTSEIRKTFKGGGVDLPHGMDG